MEVVWFKYGVAVHAQPGCRCDDMDLVGMCCPAHSVCLPTSANACTARNTVTLDVHCACASPTSLYRALRNSTMYEYSLPVGQHFTRGMNSTQRPAVPVLQGSHFPTAGQSRSWVVFAQYRVVAEVFRAPRLSGCPFPQTTQDHRHPSTFYKFQVSNIKCHICLTRQLH